MTPKIEASQTKQKTKERIKFHNTKWGSTRSIKKTRTGSHEHEVREENKLKL